MKKIFLLALGFTFAILISEISVRLLLEREEAGGNYWGLGAFIASDTVGYKQTPGFIGRAYHKGAFDCPVEISPRGLRQKNLDSQLAQQRRVLLLGDSFAFGLGVQEASSFAALVQPKLNARGMGIINGAQTGYSVEQEVKLGRELISEYRPNLIILCLFPDNDFEGDYLKDYKNVDVRYGYRLKKNRFLRVMPVDFLRTHSYLWLLVQDQLDARRGRKIRSVFRKKTKQNPLQVMESTFAALIEFKHECAKQNIGIAIVLIPSKKIGQPFVEPLRNKLTSIQIPFLDLNLKNFDETDVFHVDGHWNERGHRKAAPYIAAFIESQLEESGAK